MILRLQIQDVHHLDFLWVRALIFMTYAFFFPSHIYSDSRQRAAQNDPFPFFLCLLQSSPVSQRGLECRALERTVSKSDVLSLPTTLKDHQLLSDS